MVEGVDYSTSRPNLAQLRASGITFVCRYLAMLPNPKVITRAERAALHAAGFQIVLNWEQRTGDALLGRDKGIAHAQQALNQARTLGAPDSIPIYFSVDQDVTNANQMNAIAAYFDGVASVISRYRTGVYGEADVINAMIPTHASWGWQTYAWSGGKVSAKANFLQYRNGVTIAGADVDRNRTLKDHIGAWLPNGHADYEQEAVDMTPAQEAKLDALKTSTDALTATLNRVDGRLTAILYNMDTNPYGEGPMKDEKNALKAALTDLRQSIPSTTPGTVVLPIDGTYEVRKVQ